jgi:hypothetical protein
VPRKVKCLRDLVGDTGDALRVRVLVSLEFIYGLRKLYEGFRCRAVD